MSAEVRLDAITRHPADSVEALQTMLLALDDWGRRGRDLRGVFATAYAVVNGAILDDLASGAFRQPRWVRALVEDFGERYRLALRGHLGGREAGELPACWKLALAPRRGDGFGAVSSLLLGMVAHIRHDLPLSLHACGALDEERRLDYERLGSTICQTTPAIQREIIAAHAPELSPLHTGLVGIDTRLANRLVLDWRSRACVVAQLMHREPRDSPRWTRRLRGESAALALLTLPTWRVARALSAKPRLATWQTVAIRGYSG